MYANRHVLPHALLYGTYVNILQLKAERMTEGLEGVEELNDNDLGFQVSEADRRFLLFKGSIIQCTASSTS